MNDQEFEQARNAAIHEAFGTAPNAAATRTTPKPAKETRATQPKAVKAAVTEKARKVGENAPGRPVLGVTGQGFDALRSATARAVAESFAARERKAAKVREKAARKQHRATESVTAPMGTVPAPQEQQTQMWELSPQELRAQMDAALWPSDGSGHTWVPRAPVSLSDYIKHGI